MPFTQHVDNAFQVIVIWLSNHSNSQLAPGSWPRSYSWKLNRFLQAEPVTLNRFHKAWKRWSISSQICYWTLYFPFLFLSSGLDVKIFEDLRLELAPSVVDVRAPDTSLARGHEMTGTGRKGRDIPMILGHEDVLRQWWPDARWCLKLSGLMLICFMIQIDPISEVNKQVGVACARLWHFHHDRHHPHHHLLLQAYSLYILWLQ